MKHVNYLSFFLLTLFSISFISCSDDDDNKLNTGITNQSWTEGKSLEISQDNFKVLCPFVPEVFIPIHRQHEQVLNEVPQSCK